MSNIDILKLRRLDFSLLIVFREVLRQGSSSVAAQRLGLSQPAVSHALARFRDLVGGVLFVRQAGGLRPTPLALELAPQVEALIERAGTALARERRFDPATTDRLFRVAANDFVGSLVTAPLVARAAERAPGARLSIRFQVAPAVFKALRENELDLAIGLFVGLPDDIVAVPLFEESYLVVARHDHPALTGGLDLDAYLRLNHLVVSFVVFLTGSIDASLRRQGLSRRVAAGSPLHLSAFATVAASDLIATVPQRLARRFAPAFGLALHEPPTALDPFTVELVRARAALDDPALDWMAAMIRDVL